MTRRYIRRAVIGLLLVVLAVYLIDAAVARARALGSIEVDVFYSVIRKDGRTDYTKSDSQNEQCVNAGLPHRGMRPCWYVRSHPRKEVEVGVQKNDFWRL